MAKNALMAPDQNVDPWAWTQWAAQQDPATYDMTRVGFDNQNVDGLKPQLQAAGLWNPAWDVGAGGQSNGSDEWTPVNNRDLSALDGYQWSGTRGPGRGSFSALYGPDGQQVGQPEYLRDEGSMHGKDYATMLSVLGGAYMGANAIGAAAAGGGGAAAAGSSGYPINAAASGSLSGGASGAGVGGAASTGYGGLASGAGTLLADAGGSTVSDAGVGMSQTTGGQNLPTGSYNELGADGASQVVNTNTWAPQSSGGSSLADFFSGNGSTNDYLRAGQSLYGMYSQNKATGAAQDGNNRQLDLQTRMYEENKAQNQPLVDVRNSVLPQIQGLLKDPSSITQDPGYQFGLKQGMNQLNNRAAASGNYYSGAQMKAAQQFGQDYAGTKLDQSLNRLMGVATGTQVGVNNNQQNSNNFAVSGGNALQQGGNIRAGGYLGQYNTVNNGVNNWMQDQYDRKYWGGGP